MNSRERVLTALKHIEPDCVPIDFWAAQEVTKRLMEHWALDREEELLKKVGSDIRSVKGPTYENRKQSDGTIVDHWGVARKMVSYGKGEHKGAYAEVIKEPLKDMKSIKEIESYPGWPAVEWVDCHLASPSFAAFDPQLLNNYALVLTPDRLDRTAQLKPAMYLRGADNIFIDMIESPVLAEAIFNRIAEYYLAYNRKVFAHFAGKADIFLMGDDFGMQNGLMVSPKMWRKFFKQNFRRFIELAHSYGFKVMHHSCGSVRDLIPDFIDCGLDILQSLQPNARGMDLRDLKKEFGQDLAFQGSLCIQKVLPHQGPEEVKAMVNRQINDGRPGGGFIICTSHNIQNDTPTENIEALVEAYREYR